MSNKNQQDKSKIIAMVRKCLQISRQAHLYLKDGKYSCRARERSVLNGWRHLHTFTSLNEAKEFTI